MKRVKAFQQRSLRRWLLQENNCVEVFPGGGEAAKIRMQGSKSILNDRYVLKDLLGRGRFGVVRLGVDLAQNKQVAVKILDKTKDMSVCITECSVNCHLYDKLGARSDMTVPRDILENDKNLYMILELLDGGDLFDHIIARGSLSQGDFVRIFRSLLETTRDLHQAGVVHRDIKPENVMFTTYSFTAELPPSGSCTVPAIDHEKQSVVQDILHLDINLDKPVLTDFGLAHVFGSADYVAKPAGTFGYAAPEVLQSKSPTGFADEELQMASDIFSLGVLSYAALSGELPFSASMDGSTSVEAHLEEVYAGPRFENRRWDKVSKTGIDLIADMLHYSPLNRPGLDYIINHPWLQKKPS